MIARRFGLAVLLTSGLLLGVLPVSLRAQTVELLYDKGGVFSGTKYVTIAHAGRDGTVPPDTAAVRAADRLYFAFRPTGDWTFQEGDKKTLRQITLAQDTSTLPPKSVRLLGDEEDTTAVVSVPKSDIQWLTPITFRHKVDTTRGLSLREYYAPGYAPLRQAYEEGHRLLEAGRPLRAVEALRPFYEPVEPAFSLVDSARVVLDTASTRALNQARTTFRTLRKDLVADPNREGLVELDSFRVRLDSLRKDLGPYVEARPEAGADVKRRLKTLTASADRLYANARRIYRRNTLRIFMRETYENPKLRLYLDVLTQMLMDHESALASEGLQVDSLRIALLQTPRFAEARDRLRTEGWTTAFREIVRLVNENIHERQEVFGDKVMESLRLRRPAAPQPYYEIVAAMNALLTGNRMRFSEAWGRALEKVTHLSLLNDLQRWKLAGRRAPDAVPNRALRLAEEARSFRRKGELGAAEDRLQLAVRLADDYAPWYYELGRLKQAQGDTTAARNDFARARERAPSYAPPEVQVLRTLLAQNKYKAALARADSVRKRQSYWLLYMPKARALIGLERYDEAVQVLRGRCEPLNNKSYALYALLATAYAEMGTWKGARWAIGQAQALTPHRSAFKTLIAEVRARAKKQNISLTPTAEDTVRGGGARVPADSASGAGQQ